mgnify:CR=1 FL=1
MAVLQLLLAERVSIRDLGTIMEAIAEVAGSVTRDPRMIVEHIRTRLGRQICGAYALRSGCAGQCSGQYRCADAAPGRAGQGGAGQVH